MLVPLALVKIQLPPPSVSWFLLQIDARGNDIRSRLRDRQMKILYFNIKYGANCEANNTVRFSITHTDLKQCSCTRSQFPKILEADFGGLWKSMKQRQIW